MDEDKLATADRAKKLNPCRLFYGLNEIHPLLFIPQKGEQEIKY